MGNSSANHFPSQSWIFDHRREYYDIYISQRGGRYAEKHIVQNNPKIDKKDQMEAYHYRNKTDSPIVHIYDAEYQKGDSKCGNQKNITVYSEFIPHRLSDTVNLTHGQSLYILSEALFGFEELHYRFGSFPITDDHIGFNEEGDVRVWHNPDFGSNHLPHNNILLMSTRNPRHFDDRIEQKQQQQMVQDIWLAVDYHGHLRGDFLQRSRWFRDMNFREARDIVSREIEMSPEYVPEALNFRDSQYRREPHGDNQYGYDSRQRLNNSHHHRNDNNRSRNHNNNNNSRLSSGYNSRNQRYNNDRNSRGYSGDHYGSNSHTSYRQDSRVLPGGINQSYDRNNGHNSRYSNSRGNSPPYQDNRRINQSYNRNNGQNSRFSNQRRDSLPYQDNRGVNQSYDHSIGHNSRFTNQRRDSLPYSDNRGSQPPRPPRGISHIQEELASQYGRYGNNSNSIQSRPDSQALNDPYSHAARYTREENQATY